MKRTKEELPKTYYLFNKYGQLRYVSENLPTVCQFAHVSGVQISKIDDLKLLNDKWYISEQNIFPTPHENKVEALTKILKQL
jgi:hypothetical protein